MDLGCIDMGCVEKQKKEINHEKQNSPNGSASSKLGKNSKAKDVVRSSLNALNKLTSQITKPTYRKTSPINWFPRKKVEPYLKRKIKMLQEVDGMHLTLDETLGDTNPHYSRVLKEKMAIKEAAEKAMEARKAAMVEASWCRILQAARIESKEAEAQLSKAEADASEAFEAARAVGVIMNDAENHYKIETSCSTTHTVSATFETAFDVDKQVASAVKAALIKLANCPSINKDEFKELLRKISENPDSEENGHEPLHVYSECASESDSDTVEIMLDRLRLLREDELASLATIVATCGLNAALAESKDKNQNTCPKEPSRLSTSGRRVSELPNLDKFLVKKLTRLEREVLEAKNEAQDVKLKEKEENKVPDLGRVLLKRSSKLEKEIEEAKKKNLKSPEEDNLKVKRDSEEIPSLDKYLVKRLTRLEREVNEARNRKDFEPVNENSVEKENVNVNKVEESLDKVLVKRVSKLEREKMEFGTGEQMGMKLKRKGIEREQESKEGGLDKVLIKHVSKLEREKMEFGTGEQMGMKLKRRGIDREQESSEGSLDQVLVKHVSKLERAKMEFSTGEQMGMKLKRKGVDREQDCNEGGLDQVMIKHVSKLEREKMEFSANEQMGVKLKAKGRNLEQESSEGSLDQVLVKRKSKLEGEKMAFSQEIDDGVRHSVSRRQARDRELHDAWGGLSLGNSMQPHVSRLQRDKAAWLKADEEERKRELLQDLVYREFSTGEQMGMKLKRKGVDREQDCNEGGLDQVMIKHVSKLEREKMEFSANEQMGVKLKAKGRNLEQESSEGSLDQVLVKRKSKLEGEKMAFSQEIDDGVRHSVSRRQARDRELHDAWGGLSLGNSMQPHVSRLQRDKAAWLKADEEERKRELLQDV